jgi:hypothetical protein
MLPSNVVLTSIAINCGICADQRDCPRISNVGLNPKQNIDLITANNKKKQNPFMCVTCITSEGATQRRMYVRD